MGDPVSAEEILQEGFSRLTLPAPQQRILVTGAAGFIGSNFTRHLLENTPYAVASLDRLDDAGNLERLAELKTRFPARLQCFWHDLKAPLHSSLIRGDFRYIVHMAAGSHVDRSHTDPIGFVMDNIVGTANLLEWARKNHPTTKLLYFGTDEIFGPAPAGVDFHEHARFEPENMYAATKAGGELLCLAYVHQHHMPIVATHCCNVFGPMQHREKFIPLAIEKISRGDVLQIHARGGVSSSRLYIHVDDVARAVMTVLERGGVIHDDASGRYNIRADLELSNLDVAQRIALLLKQPLRYELVENPTNRPKPDMRYALSDSKLRALGWAPRVEFDAGLADVVRLADSDRALRSAI